MKLDTLLSGMACHNMTSQVGHSIVNHAYFWIDLIKLAQTL